MTRKRGGLPKSEEELISDNEEGCCLACLCLALRMVDTIADAASDTSHRNAREKSAENHRQAPPSAVNPLATSVKVP